MMIIGIDPGSRHTGWGVVEEKGNSLHLVDCGIINAVPTEEFPRRLADIYCQLGAVLERLRPCEAAIEQVFMAKNAMSALKLGQARGVAIAACASRGIFISEYTPTAVKQALVGTGHAGKEQVAFMVSRILGVRGSDWKLDTTDALALAICHLNSQRFFQKTAAALAAGAR